MTSQRKPNMVGICLIVKKHAKRTSDTIVETTFGSHCIECLGFQVCGFQMITVQWGLENGPSKL